MKTLIHERVAMARAGENPMAFRRVASGWIVLGDVLFVRGYSLLLPDLVVPDINALMGAGLVLCLAADTLSLPSSLL